MKRRDMTKSERKELRGETAGGAFEGAIAGATAGSVAGVKGAIIGGVIGAIGGGAMARREEKAAIETGRAAKVAKKAENEAIHRAQEFEREAQAAAAKGPRGAPARPFISDDATLIQSTDVGGGTAYDRWYRQNFTA